MKIKKYPLVYAIALKDTNTQIGHVGLSYIEDNKIEIGYSISEKYQNKGYAKEAVKSFAKWVKEILGLSEIYGLVKALNTSSFRVLEHEGFIYESEAMRDFFGKKYLMRTYVYK